MRLKCFVLLFVFAIAPFPSFSAVNTNSASGSPSPEVKFKEWQIGLSEKGTDISNTVHTSFITSTETTCLVKASV